VKTHNFRPKKAQNHAFSPDPEVLLSLLGLFRPKKAQKVPIRPNIKEMV
jgi:hypothetical protein